MQNEISAILEKEIASLDFELLPFQRYILTNVLKNVAGGKKSQTVLLPVGAGKTTLVKILAKTFLKTGKKVLIITEGVGHKVMHQQVYSGTDRESNESITVCSITEFLEKPVPDVDFILNDGLAVLSKIDEEHTIDEIVEIIEKNSGLKGHHNLSIAQKTALSVKRISTYVEQNHPFVIEFERTSLPAIEQPPIFAATDNITYRVTAEALREYKKNVIPEVERIIVDKAETIIKNNGNADSALLYDGYIKRGYDELKKISDLYSKMNGRLDRIENNVSEILNIARDTYNKVSEQLDDSKKILSAYSLVHPDEDEESNEFFTRIIDDLCKRIGGNIEQLQKQTNYESVKEILKVSLGEDVWDKMSDESQKFLISAKIFFMENLSMGDKVDYSSICLLASKAFETELAARVFFPYKDYVDDRFSDISKWPPALVKTKYGNTTPLTTYDFNLGLVPYLIGCAGEYTDRQQNSRVFKDYCKEQLHNTTNQGVDDAIRQISQYTRAIKDNYRNPAAHKDTLSMKAALDCLSYIVDVEKALKNTLELFKF